MPASNRMRIDSATSQMIKQVTTQRNRNTLNLFVDIAIFLAFLMAMAPHFSGMPCMSGSYRVWCCDRHPHLLLHWQWITEVTRRFFGKAQSSARVNYVLSVDAHVRYRTISIVIGETTRKPSSFNQPALARFTRDYEATLRGLNCFVRE